ncbi:MAG TPA: hypothetical protein VLG10_16560 [Methylomirabilota bacterium]|nr:hypothetical protein [Methylomirabilota bacterium]
MIGSHRSAGALAIVLLILLAPSFAPAGAASPEGQVTWAVHTTLVPSWFDPAEALHGTPFMVLHALHDARPEPQGQGSCG